MLGCGSGSGSVSGSVWETVWSQALDVDSPTWNGNTLRQYLDDGLYSVSGSGFRLTLQSGSGAEGAKISSIYAGHAASTNPVDDFDGTQVPLTVGGLSAFTIPANSSVVTDNVFYAFDAAKSFLVAAHFDDAANDTIRGKNAIANVQNHFKAGAADTSGDTGTGYTTQATTLRLVTALEVLTP